MVITSTDLVLLEVWVPFELFTEPPEQIFDGLLISGSTGLKVHHFVFHRKILGCLIQDFTVAL